MAIILNDNIKINAGKPSESKYLSSGNTAYVSVTDAYTSIPIAERYVGLTVLIDTGTTNVEYWWKENVQNADLVEKKFSSEQLIGDFVTGATNLGYFEGQSGIQRLTFNGFPTSPVDFNGYYYSEYNWYYSDAAGVIRLGSPTYNGPLRRAYVDATRTKSWIYNVATSGWILSWNDVSANVGNTIIGYGYDGSGYTQTEWISDYQSNGFTGIFGVGSLTTGNTLSVGYPTYVNKTNQELNFRTIINDTPEFLKISTDDNYLHFSGTSSVVNGENFGTGNEIFTGKTGSNLGFRTLKQSGDTSISLDNDGSLIIYSSSDGSANAITGATNYGGGASVYSGTTNRNLQFRTLLSSGNTSITEIGSGAIVIGSSGGGSDVFTEDITVSIAAGKTFGKYENGDVIPASGKTSNEVILLSLAEPLDPTINLSSSSSNIIFGLASKTVNVTFSYTINTVGATVATTLLEWRRGNSGSWLTLTSNTGDTSYFHTIDDSGNRFNSAIINYRYTVTDTAGATTQTIYNVNPQTYAAPNISPTYNASALQSYETNTSREIGNVNTNIGGSIVSNRSLVKLLAYRIQRDDGSGYVTIASEININALSKTITNYLDNAATSNAISIKYRVVVDDEYQNNNYGAVYTINLKYSSYFGYSTNTTLTGAQIVALHNEALLSSRVRTVDPVTAPVSNYTYISYPTSFGDITSIIMDGTVTIQTPSGGAFTKLTNVSVNNFYGETVNNIIYKSNAPEAFTNNELAFS